MMASGREAALKILYETEQKDGYLNIVFANHMRGSDLPREERALAKELVSGVMQHKITLDYVIRSYSSIRLKKISPYILQILRKGIYQLYYMDKIPASAAVNESVKLAKKYGHKASSGFVNAILHKASDAGKIKLPDKKQNVAEYLSVAYSHPGELVKWYIETFGVDRAESLLAQNNVTPPIEARVNTLKASREDVIKILADEGITAHESDITGCGIVLERGKNPEKTRAYHDGLFSIQGISSQLAALALSPKAGETVLDLCCAPGGKTAHLAELMKNEGEILASDLYEHRLSQVRENAKRLGISIIKASQMDALAEKKEYLNKADKILLDVPCSGLGIIRRKPDIKYKDELSDFGELVLIQKNILNICAKYLKIEGELIYSTCTINPQENMGVVNSFLEKNPDFCIVSAASEYIGDKINSDMEKGYITLYPDSHGCDGFFICKLKRRG